MHRLIVPPTTTAAAARPRAITFRAASLATKAKEPKPEKAPKPPKAEPKPVPETTTLVLLRHGQSTWNKTNQFTGWVDVPLTPQGEAEAKEAGKLIKDMEFDLVYCSMLKRAIKTLWLALEEADKMWLPVVNTWRLNERHYGDLQGMNKNEAVLKFGEKMVMDWRRSYSIPPPPVTEDSEHFPGKDKRYAGVPAKNLPRGESLATTLARFLPAWNKNIVPEIKKGKKILITAHGNSLRALIQHLEGLSDEEIIKLNVPTGVPLVYEIHTATQKLVDGQKSIPGTGVKGLYLGDAQKILAAVQGVADQTKKKQ